MAEDYLHQPGIVACVWDFDKTLINGYMQKPLFTHFGVDEQLFWREVNALPELYAERGTRVSADTIYLNHLLTYVRAGIFGGLNNALLRELGAGLEFCPGLPGFFRELRELVAANALFRKHNIVLEHYIVSTGLAEMIRGTVIAEEVDGIFGCEFIESPAPPHFLSQAELSLEHGAEIAQIGMMVDNTIKTRFLFEINKGTNKNPAIDVNAKIAREDRRVPLKNMIYIADGPSDIPAFSVVRKGGGRSYAVYHPEHPSEFEQNDNLLQCGRIHAYGPANYTKESSTHMWIRMHVLQICERIVKERDYALANRVSRPPRHLHPAPAPAPEPPSPQQDDLFGGG